MDCFIFNNESINKIKDAVIIEGPDAVLNSSEENNPIITDNLSLIHISEPTRPY